MATSEPEIISASTTRNDAAAGPSSASPQASFQIAPYFAVGPEPQELICPLCHEKTRTTMRSKSYWHTSIFDCATCLSCCFPALLLLCAVRPLCPNRVVHHYCMSCKGYVGKFRRP